MSVTDIIIDVIIRPAVPADLASIQRICNEVLELEPDARELPVILSASPERHAVVAEASGKIVGACFGSMGPRRGDMITGHVELLVVAADASGHGAGRMLLTSMEDWLRNQGAVEVILGANPPVYLWPGIDVRYTAMTCLAIRAGYERFRDAIDMAVDLTTSDLDYQADEERLAALGIAVRRAASAEAGLVVSWLRAGPWGQSTWPDEAAAALDREPVACHVACRDSGYVGFACHGCVRAGWFGPMGTLAEEREHGIGSLLLKRCLADMKAAGQSVARIGWVGPVQFYARSVDARIERVYWLYRKTL